MVMSSDEELDGAPMGELESRLSGLLLSLGSLLGRMELQCCHVHRFALYN